MLNNTNHLSYFEGLVVPDNTFVLSPGGLPLFGQVRPRNLSPVPSEVNLFIMLLMTILQPVQKLFLNRGSLLLLDKMINFKTQ